MAASKAHFALIQDKKPHSQIEVELVKTLTAS
jgi:hypothetical protein